MGQQQPATSAGFSLTGLDFWAVDDETARLNPIFDSWTTQWRLREWVRELTRGDIMAWMMGIPHA